MRVTRLRWFGYLKRSVDTPVRKCERINILESRRGRGRPKMRSNEVIIKDLKILGLKEGRAQDRRL